MKRFFLISFVIWFCSIAYAQTEEGVWETFDNKRKKAMSHVQIYQKDGKLYGKIIKVLDPTYAICKKCKDKDKNKPMVGLMVIRGLEKNGKKWEKDDGILDPISGFLVDGVAWLESANKLKVKGSFGFISDTQTWTRIK